MRTTGFAASFSFAKATSSSGSVGPAATAFLVAFSAKPSTVTVTFEKAFAINLKPAGTAA